MLKMDLIELNYIFYVFVNLFVRRMNFLPIYKRVNLQIDPLL